MSLRPTLKFLAAATIGMASATAAQAQLVTQWTFDVTTNWITADTVFRDGLTAGPAGTTTNTDTLISWGAAGGDHTVLGADPGSARSALSITPAVAVSGTAITNGGFEDTHTFTHFNNAINASFDALQSTSVLTTLSLTPLVPPGPALPTFETEFGVNFTETLNAEPCFSASDSTCDDVFVVTFAGDLTTSFVFNGVTYTVEIAGALQPLDASACAAAGVAAGCVGLQTIENAITQAPFAFQITAAVPTPGVLALIGLGLAGLGFASRRRPS